MNISIIIAKYLNYILSMHTPDYTLIFPSLLVISPIAAAFLRGRGVLNSLLGAAAFLAVALAVLSALAYVWSCECSGATT